MVNASEGWIVGEGGTIIRWNGIQWIPEIPENIFSLLLITSTLIVAALTKTCTRELLAIRGIMGSTMVTCIGVVSIVAFDPGSC
jgi:hypothetical protein